MKRKRIKKWLILILILNILNIYAKNNKRLDSENNTLNNPLNLAKSAHVLSNDQVMSLVYNTNKLSTINNKLNSKPRFLKKATVLSDDISTLPKNQIIPLVNDGTNFTTLTVDGSENCAPIVGCTDDWTADGANAIDNNLTNFTTSSILLVDIDVLTVTYPTEDIPAGTYAGFRIQSSSLLGLLSNITIRTRDNGGNIVDTYSPSSNLLSNTLDFSGQTNIGFITTGNFRTLEIVVSGLATVSTLDVYHPFIKIYEENATALSCNEIAAITNTQYPIEIDDVGVTGVSVSLIGDVIENVDLVIDANQNNSATLNTGLVGVGVLATSYLSVKKQKDFSTGIVTPFATNTYAGFNITSVNLLTLNVLDNITISTYLNNVFREDNSTYNTLLNVPLLNVTSQNIGFVTTMNYDEIRITVSQPIGVNLGEININYPVIKSYCANTTLSCNEQVAWVNTSHPVEISKASNSGLIAVGGSVDNLNNIINDDTTDYAEIGLNVNAISSLELGVYDVLQEYTAPHFVGFEIETSSLLEVSLLNNISLATYLNGVATGDTVNGVNILLSTPLLTGTNRQTIGLVTTNTFDEVRIQFNTTVGVNLGTIKIYNSTIQKMCSKVMECVKTYYINSPEFSTFVDYGQTKVGDLACAGCLVSNTDAVLSSSNADFASINITAGIAATASLAVRDATNAYPANSYAGFVVKSNSSAVQLSLFESLTVQSLDQNGNVLETATGASLLNVTLLANLVGGTPSGLYNVGFKPTQNYYGIKITAKKLIDVNTTLDLTDNNDLNIYGAFVDTRGALGPGFEGCLDTDKDLVIDLTDLDDDNDGILDILENGGLDPILDTDGDGIFDYKDADTTGFIDSNLDNIDDRFDFDLDGIINQYDLDSDNDGCPDVVEAAVPTVLKSHGVNATDGILDNTVNAIINIIQDPVDINGLSNSLEDVDTNAAIIINSYTTSNYNNYALDNTKNGCGMPIITQVYWKGSEKIVEITNKDANNVLVPNSINLNLFESGSSSRGATASNSNEIESGNSILFTAGTITAQTKAGVAIITDSNITNFDAIDDIITVSRSGSAVSTLSWDSRIDIIQGLKDNTSFVRMDVVSAPNKAFLTSEWVPFIDNNISTIFNDFLRHPQAPLISEITSSVNTDANALLGLHNFGSTTRTGNVWANGFPDRSRYVIINENYKHENSRLSARKLEVQGTNILSLDNQLLIVSNNLNIADDAEIRLIGASQLVQTHAGIANITGNGKIYIEQNSDLASIYRYNYMSSPVSTLSESTYTLASVFKDGTNPLINTGVVGQGATDIARDINFVGGYDGSVANPINIAEHWIYTFSSADGIRSSWTQKGRNGQIPITDGFIFKGPGAMQNYTFVGNPNDGDYTTAVGAGASYLLGNPFPSAINGLKFIQDNINSIDGTLYFWDQVGEESTAATNDGHSYAGYVGGYATINLSMGVSAVGKVPASAFSITLESEDASTNGTQTNDNGTNVVTLDENNKYLEFQSLPKATDTIKIIYKASTNKSLTLKINNVITNTYTLDASASYTEFIITKCLEVGVEIRLESLDNTPILIDHIIIADADGEISCAPGTGSSDSLYKTPGSYIPVGQGFFIGGDDTGGNIVFNNSQRAFITETSGTSVFFKNAQKTNQNATSSNSLPGIKLSMEYVNSTDGVSYQRQIGVSFNANNSFGFDKGYDSEIYDIGETDMYWKFPNDDIKYVIAGIQSLSDDLEIPIEIVLNYDGTIVLQIDESSIESDVFLKDNVTNTIHSLNYNTVALQLQEGTYTDRFSLVFNESVLSVEDDINKGLTKDLSVFMDNTSDEIVIRNHENSELHKVELFNLLGKKVYEWKNIENIFETKLKVGNLANQIYIVNIQKDQENISKKIIIE